MIMGHMYLHTLIFICPRIKKSHSKRHELLFSRTAKLNNPTFAG